MKGMETALAALLRSSRRLWICRAVFGLFIIVVIVTDSADIIRNTSDIDVFLHASEQILVGQDIYATSISEHRRFYVYLPLLAVLLIPLAGLLQEFVIVCWITFDVILLGWVIHAFYKWINGNSLFDLKRETRWTLYVVVLALCLDTVLFHLRHGQTNVQVLALAVLAAGFAAKKKELAAGLILGIAAVIKIIVFPIAAFLIFQRGGRVALGFLAGGLTGLLFAAIVVGLGKNIAYLQYWTENVALRSDPQNHFVPFWNNVSLQALAYRLFTETPAFDHKGTSYSLSILSLPDHWVHAAGICIVLAVIAVPLVYRVRYRTESALVSQWGGIALAFALAPLFTPVAEKHHFVLLVPAYVYIASLWRDSRMKDRVFRGLVFGSFISTTLTAKFFVGNFVNKFLFASGAIAFGAILLAAAIFRAAHCLEAER